MAYRWRSRDSVEANLIRIARQQVDRAIEACDRGDADPVEAVHDVRKRCKKVRSLLRLCRHGLGSAYRGENARFRELARELSAVRDTQVLAGTLRGLVDEVGTDEDAVRFVAWIDRLSAADVAGGACDLPDRLEEVRATLRDAHHRIEHWKISANGFDAIEPGLRRTYRRGRRAMHAAQDAGTMEAYHAWRKRAKDYWYHMRLLEPLWPEALRAVRRAAHRLAETLGDEHDLGVLETALADGRLDPGDPDARERLLALSAPRRLELRRRADWYGERLYAERPSAFASRIEGYWRAAGVSG